MEQNFLTVMLQEGGVDGFFLLSLNPKKWSPNFTYASVIFSMTDFRALVLFVLRKLLPRFCPQYPWVWESAAIRWSWVVWLLIFPRWQANLLFFAVISPKATFKNICLSYLNHWKDKYINQKLNLLPKGIFKQEEPWKWLI